ncbi:MAG: MerR family transcriptional regulator [Candidatus Shapirobacteria bacterium]|jgi:DNA-binding transcriptional MerR regulator
MLNQVKSASGGTNLITAGEFAKLAGTTKRTIIWYDQNNIIKPVEVSPEGYRYYNESQVLDYQMVLLLTTLGVTLKDIRQKGDLKALFEKKKKAIKDQINTLKFNLSNLEKFLANIESNGTMIRPLIKILKPLEVFYIERIGSYVKIGQYCQELRSMFSSPGRSFTTAAIFDNPTYQPKKSLIKICALVQPGMKINPQYKNVVQKMTFNPGKVITYTHNGVGEMVSLFWKELEKYCRLNHLQVRHDVPDFEIYRKISSDPKKQFFEIYLPIF